MVRDYVIALYIRLSIEDYKYDSLSIENQRLILCFYRIRHFSYTVSMPATAI